MKTYRDNGAPGALLDEYEKALNELKELILTVDNEELIKIRDHETKDESCRSIQTILTHVISAGYSYIIQMRNFLGENLDYIEVKPLSNSEEYCKALDKMMAYNEQFFKDYPDLDLDDFDGNRFKVRWGPLYDIEQLFEHAIVHILRHRRQIERFLLR